jgi:hypothetical protein
MLSFDSAHQRCYPTHHFSNSPVFIDSICDLVEDLYQLLGFSLTLDKCVMPSTVLLALLAVAFKLVTPHHGPLGRLSLCMRARFCVSLWCVRLCVCVCVCVSVRWCAFSPPSLTLFAQPLSHSLPLYVFSLIRPTRPLIRIDLDDSVNGWIRTTESALPATGAELHTVLHTERNGLEASSPTSSSSATARRVASAQEQVQRAAERLFTVVLNRSRIGALVCHTPLYSTIDLRTGLSSEEFHHPSRIPSRAISRRRRQAVERLAAKNKPR